MKLVKMIINNYRQFEKAVLDFDDDVTILAGANNSGKTSLITLIRNMMSKEQVTYSESDIPAKNMRVWIDKVYPLFKNFFTNDNGIDAIETELLDKILPESDKDEKLVIKTTEVYIQVVYNVLEDDIKLLQIISWIWMKKNTRFILFMHMKSIGIYSERSLQKILTKLNKDFWIWMIRIKK